MHNELRQKRKVALRLGNLSLSEPKWVINQQKMSSIIKNKEDLSSLTDKDFSLNVRQKGIDIMIGVDIASLTYKKLVDQIILVAGDADFVPAAKLARREGIDFILDPMWNHISEDLFEHIDGLQSVCPNPSKCTDNLAPKTTQT